MCARAFFTKFSAVFMCILYNDSPRFMGIIPKGNRNRPLFFGSPGKSGIVFHGSPILREPSKAPCRGRPAFWPGSSLQKAILLPTGCVCFEQEKRGPVYPHLVQLTLEDFSAFSIIIVTGTKAFCKGLFCPLQGAFLFCRNAEGAAPVRILDKDGKVYGKLYRAEKHPWSVRSTV